MMPITYPLVTNHSGKNKNNKEIISELYNDGVSLRDIANTFGISHMTVYRTIKSQHTNLFSK